MKKNLYLLSVTGWNDFIPVLWPSAKTYYELNGDEPDKYNWVLPVCEMYTDIEDIKASIQQAPPAIFGVSLYVWNYEKSLALCKWVKETWPNCIVMAGGPHQYFKHHGDWFKKHWFIDASLPSEVYGEIAITDLLNNLQDDNSINWNTVEQMVYPSKNKSLTLHSKKATNKKDFKWGYSAYEAQHANMQEYVDHYYNVAGRQGLHCKIETTRGCPYSCTFCDWGGGIGGKVILKDLNTVKTDLKILLSYNVSSVYVCDANFGINGKRDVDVVRFIADEKKTYGSKKFPNVQYGGYAKTNKHFGYLKEIFTIEAENDLSYVYKISQQSFHDDVLVNVKRTDLRANEHFELADHLRKTYSYDATVELIFGLPGITLDKWYTEFDKPYEWDVVIRAYDWFLLPEAESFSKEYREKYGIETAKKWLSDEDYSIPSEIVVGGFSCTRQDHIKIKRAYAVYVLFIQSGIYKNTIDNVLEKNNIKFGEFLKRFIDECYPRFKQARFESFSYVENHLAEFVSGEVNNILHNINYENHAGIELLEPVYYIFEFFKNSETLNPILMEWLMSMGADEKICKDDSELILTPDNLNSVNRSFLSKIDFTQYKSESELLNVIRGAAHYTHRDILVGTKSWSIHPMSLIPRIAND